MNPFATNSNSKSTSQHENVIDRNRIQYKYQYNHFGKRNIIPDRKSITQAETTRPHISDSKRPSDKSHEQVNSKRLCENDYTNHYIHHAKFPTKYISNVEHSSLGYPKLQRLQALKRQQVTKHSVKPFGCKIEQSHQIIPILNQWISEYHLQFDVIMIGALVENQFLLPLLLQLPLHKLCSKPGFLFIWSTTNKIKELSHLLNKDTWNKKFRRSEELVFIPVDENSPFFPNTNDSTNDIFEKKQWHCWMCITGTVRRATDNHLIHCNIDTDLQIENSNTNNKNNAVPDVIYRVAENFANLNRRLHIIPTRTGYNLPVRLREGWVIMSPDILVDNFDPQTYEHELYTKSSINYKNPTMNHGKQSTQFLVPQTEEIEELRPKSPVDC